jgi:2-hydroxychromene-2-carboxylate isomerase
MVFAERSGELKGFALAAMRLAFLEGADLGDPDTALEAARRAGVDAVALSDALSGAELKEGLRETTDQAVALGVFGVPSVIVGEELFWGDDRLEDAAAASRSRPAS